MVSNYTYRGVFPVRVEDDGCLMVKFDRTAVAECLIGKGYCDGDEVTLTVSSSFTDGMQFSGQDIIKVVNN